MPETSLRSHSGLAKWPWKAPTTSSGAWWRGRGRLTCGTPSLGVILHLPQETSVLRWGSEKSFRPYVAQVRLVHNYRGPFPPGPTLFRRWL